MQTRWEGEGSPGAAQQMSELEGSLERTLLRSTLFTDKDSEAQGRAGSDRGDIWRRGRLGIRTRLSHLLSQARPQTIVLFMPLCSDLSLLAVEFSNRWILFSYIKFHETTSNLVYFRHSKEDLYKRNLLAHKSTWTASEWQLEDNGLYPPWSCIFLSFETLRTLEPDDLGSNPDSAISCQGDFGQMILWFHFPMCERRIIMLLSTKKGDKIN